MKAALVLISEQLLSIFRNTFKLLETTVKVTEV